MKQIYYNAINITLLIILAITFYFQVQAFRERSSMQWILLIVIGIVGLTSYLLSKQMKKEHYSSRVHLYLNFCSEQNWELP